ncbi:hypothetical protein GCM10015535_30790 [Streptomyces gelaticus]|uniref:ATP-binding protein n=2 Tax=Streptomyces gelaticus TaxID=285446 RepID=A0ABQ2W1Z7_9ACTN|nr:hypothetical protein GCM10015535_30790 [Streptomyces gelaticus]
MFVGREVGWLRFGAPHTPLPKDEIHMKKSAVRTLGVAALGAAFAAAAAGTASAAVLPADTAGTALPVAGTALGTATQSLPAQETTTKLLGTGQQKLADDATTPVKGLLGGLPAGGLKTSGLKTGGLSTSGLPLGG